jgi:hypothetical protein
MLGYLLKFTRAIFQAMGAIHRVTGQEQFQSSAGKSHCFWSASIDYHPFCHRRSTGCNWIIFTFYLHETETAGSKRLAPFPNGTKIGNIDVIVQSCPQNLFTGGSSYFAAVNRQRDFFDVRQYSLLVLSSRERTSEAGSHLANLVYIP